MVEHIVKCPACTEGKVQILSDQIDIPHFGEIMISTLICPNCGYRSSDIVPLKNSSPMRYILKVDDLEKLKVRVVRSGSSTVIIPEIGARIDPGVFSEGYVTNVEGILKRFQDILFQILRDSVASSGSGKEPTKEDQIKELIKLLGSYLEGNIPENRNLTLIIEDPLGNSAIIPDEDTDIVTEPLLEEEIAEMLSTRMDKDIITDL
jgi:zinc finger protein